MNDERSGKYRFMYEYNSETNTKMKKSLGNIQAVKFWNRVYTVVVITIVIAVMFAFEIQTYDEVDTVS